MTVIVSQSLYPVQGFEHRFYHGNRYHCLSAKVTLQWDAEGRLTPLARQPDLVLNDVWLDEENRSSLLYPSDLIPYKPTTDVLVTGSVRPPEDGLLPTWYVALRIGEQEKRLRVHGPRHWRHTLLGGWTLSEPEPVSAVALLYENAYGGTLGPLREHYEEGEFYPPNPLGCGFVDRSRADTAQLYPAAQIESWDAPLVAFGQDVEPGGFGPLPGFVPARQQYAGTYDEQWRQTVAPNIPQDMDMRYWNTAPADQQPPAFLKAGDVIELAGTRPGPPLRLVLPPFDAAGVAHWEDESRETHAMMLDTVLIDLDRDRVTLRFHGLVDFDERIKRINVYCAPTTYPAGS